MPLRPHPLDPTPPLGSTDAWQCQGCSSGCRSYALSASATAYILPVVCSRVFTMVSSPTVVRDRTRDKALLIGLQYDSSVGRLSTPHRDVALLKDFLVDHEGYVETNIDILTDDPENGRIKPKKARASIEAAMEGFMQDVRPGDRRVFFFAGHGYQIVNRTGTEIDNLDEVILVDSSNGAPLDAEQRPLDPGNLTEGHPDRKKLDGIITDNFLREKLVDTLPAGAHLVAIFDTCHSGTMLDLDYHWTWQHLPRLPQKSRSGSGFMIDSGTQVGTTSWRCPNMRRLSVSRARACNRNVCGGRKRSNTRSGASRSPISPRNRNSFVPWMHDSPAEPPSQCTSPIQIQTPAMEVPNVLSISSAMDSQRAWAREDTMLSVLLDMLRAAKSERPKVGELMKELQSKTEAIRIAAFQSVMAGRGKRLRSNSQLVKVKALQHHQFGSLVPCASEHEFEL